MSDSRDTKTRATAPISDKTMEFFLRRREQRGGISLVILSGNGVDVHALEQGVPITVGRSAPAGIQVDEQTLSREHARFCLRGEQVQIEDLGSTNGTWLGGEQVTEVSRTVPVDIMLGSVQVRIRDLGGSDPLGDQRASGDVESLIAGAAMQPVFEVAQRVANSHIAVILFGETGVGKEVLAHFIHDNSPRKHQPIVSLNCGAIPRELLESTLFGHERGAFTGAHKAKRGVFEAADGGTLFLDEIGDLPADAQVALLRVLENGCITRVGAVEERPVDVRIIAASHRDLSGMVAAGAFRADLFYRLETVTLEIPPLRERLDEIKRLTELFLRRANQLHGRAVSSISQAALEQLHNYPWPGNVRELRNAIERAVVISQHARIQPADLPARIASHECEVSGAVPVAASEETSRTVPTATSETSVVREASRQDGSLRDRMQRYESQLILHALHTCHWNRAQAARMLDMPVRTLAHKIKTLGLRRDRDD